MRPSPYDSGPARIVQAVFVLAYLGGGAWLVWHGNANRDSGGQTFLLLGIILILYGLFRLWRLWRVVQAASKNRE